MRAYVRLLCPNEQVAELGPGDIIGRSAVATLAINDACVSEAHAMVSLRGDQLMLLSLRGRFTVNGTMQRDVALEAGQTIHLAPELAYEVLETSLPESVLGIEGPGLPRRVLTGVCSLALSPKPTLTTQYNGDADAHLWSSGAAWFVRVRGEKAKPLRAGGTFEIQGQSFRACAIPLESAQARATRIDQAMASPIRIIARYDTVHIERDGKIVETIGGVAARTISELVSFGVPVPWAVLAGEVWPGDDPSLLRHRLDVTLSRLRRRLKNASIRSDIISNDGAGNFELHLRDGDEVVDDT